MSRSSDFRDILLPTLLHAVPLLTSSQIAWLLAIHRLDVPAEFLGRAMTRDVRIRREKWLRARARDVRPTVKGLVAEGRLRTTTHPSYETFEFPARRRFRWGPGLPAPPEAEVDSAVAKQLLTLRFVDLNHFDVKCYYAPEAYERFELGFPHHPDSRERRELKYICYPVVQLRLACVYLTLLHAAPAAARAWRMRFRDDGYRTPFGVIEREGVRTLVFVPAQISAPYRACSEAMARGQAWEFWTTSGCLDSGGDRDVIVEVTPPPSADLDRRGGL